MRFYGGRDGREAENDCLKGHAVTEIAVLSNQPIFNMSAFQVKASDQMSLLQELCMAHNGFSCYFHKASLLGMELNSLLI